MTPERLAEIVTENPLDTAAPVIVELVAAVTDFLEELEEWRAIGETFLTNTHEVTTVRCYWCNVLTPKAEITAIAEHTETCEQSPMRARLIAMTAERDAARAERDEARRERDDARGGR